MLTHLTTVDGEVERAMLGIDEHEEERTGRFERDKQPAVITP